MIKIYTAKTSTPGNAVLICANALGISYELITYHPILNPKNTPEYLALNPVGKIPTLVDGDFSLFEHFAIVKYLCQKYQSPFYPTDTKEQAKTDQWSLFIGNHIYKDGIALIFRNRLLPIFLPSFETSPVVLKQALVDLDRYLTVMDAQLKKTGTYVIGQQMTIADFLLLAFTDVIDLLRISLEPYPHFKKWRDHMRTQEFYKKVHASYTESFRAYLPE